MRGKIALVFMLLGAAVVAGNTICYTVMDGNKPLEGAIVTVSGITTQSQLTDAKGKVSFEVRNGYYHTSVIHLGYYDFLGEFRVTKDTCLTIAMHANSASLKGVTVSQRKPLAKVMTYQPGAIVIDARDIKQFPKIAGETDPIRYLQLLPGISFAHEASADLNIRGGAKDQTMLSVNGMPIFAQEHLLGLYSTFNDKALKNISLYRDNVAGRYGSFGMSVVNFDYLSDSIAKPLHTLKLGMLGNTLSSKGSIVKDKWYYNVNARTSYTFFTNEIPADFWDFSFASTYHINERNKLEIITQLSNDNMLLAEIYNTAITFSKSSNFAQLAWQNWNAPKNRKIENKIGFSQYTKIGTALTFDEAYDDETLLAINANGQEWYSYHLSVEQPLYNGIRIDYGVQSMLGRNIERDHQYQFEGLNYSKPFVYGQFSKSVLNQAINIVPYLDLSLDTNNWSYHAALRPNIYNNLTTGYTAIPLEASLGVNKSIRLNTYSLALDRRAQINHNINPYFIANDLERWSFANEVIKPQLVNQVALSVLHKRTKIAWTNSIYAKNITNVYVYRDGANIFLNDFSTEVLPTKGYAYGFETGLVYNTPVQTISLNYTFSRSFLQTPDINRSLAFPADFDRPHSLKYFHSLRIRKHTTFSLNAILVSGRPLTVIEYAEGPFYIFSDRNEYRLPFYKRIDLSFNHNRTFFRGKMFTEISYGAYNVANFRNPFFVVYGGSGIDKEGNYITKYDFINLMPIIPYISLEVSF